MKANKSKAAEFEVGLCNGSTYIEPFNDSSRISVQENKSSVTHYLAKRVS